MEPWTVAPVSERPVDPADVLAPFAAQGWWPDRTEAVMGTVLASGPSVGAWAGDRLVGFARAVSDGAYRAYVEDVAVTEPFRRSGIAAALVNALLDGLPPTAMVSLFCGPELTGLYERAGFTATRQVVLHRSPTRTN